MAISQTMAARLNEQIASEFNASQTYLSMACMFEAMGLKNLAKLFRKQTDEERGHALKIIDFLPTVEATVKIGAIPEPPASWPSVEAAVESALAHERKVTEQFNQLMSLAEQERDFATRSFLTWFVDEQVEEVDSMLNLLQAVRMAGKNLLQLEAYVHFAASK